MSEGLMMGGAKKKKKKKKKMRSYSYCRPYLSDVHLTTSSALEVDSTDGTGNVVVAARLAQTQLVNKQSHFVFEILVTFATVVMFRILGFMGFHVLNSPECARAVLVGAMHSDQRGWVGHFGTTLSG